MKQLIFNNIILLSLVLISSFSCTRNNYTKHTRHIEISSLVELNIACVISSLEKEEKIILYGKSTGSLEIVKERFGEGSFTDNEIHNNFFISIYNLTDTSSFLQNTANISDKHIFNNHFDYYDIDYEVTKINQFYDAFTLTIDSTLLPIFKKDYNMIELFSEYYE